MAPAVAVTAEAPLQTKNSCPLAGALRAEGAFALTNSSALPQHLPHPLGELAPAVRLAQGIGVHHAVLAVVLRRRNPW